MTQTSHAPYASNKYRNTMELLDAAENIYNGIINGRLKMGALETHRLKSTYRTLMLKAAVLGYLEDLTKGGCHKREVSREELGQYIDWAVKENPGCPFPISQFPEAYGRVQYLQGFISGAEDRDRAVRAVLRSFYIESRPEIDLAKVENLVLAGGGAKALSLAGAVCELENRGLSPQIKRVAGTSGGAIIAMVFAAGYSGEELNDLVMQNEFGLFTLDSRADNWLLNQWAHHFARDKPNSKMHILSDNTLAHIYHQALMDELAIELSSFNRPIPFMQVFGDAVRPLCERGQPAGSVLATAIEAQSGKDSLPHDILDALGEDVCLNVDVRARRTTLNRVGHWLAGGVVLYPTPRRALVSAMRHMSGQDLIRGFFQDLLYDKLSTYPEQILKDALYGHRGASINTPLNPSDLRRINFEQWQRLHQLMPERVKELHVSMSIVRPFNMKLERLLNHYEHQDASHEHPEFSALPVCDAVRVSMNLPPVYPKYKFSIRGKTYLGSDGGLKSNMSLGTFDKKYPVEQTIGVFYKTSKELVSAADVNRMLVLPRSKKELLDEIISISRSKSECESELNVLQITLHQQSSYKHPNDVLISRIQSQIVLVNERARECEVKLEAVRAELEVIQRSKSGRTLRWLSNPSGQFGRLLDRYLDTKSQDDLSKGHNLRRLVMVNTHDIDTMHFKMTQSQKGVLLLHGKKAMRSLLNGTYCLENHFYYHHLQSIRMVQIDNGLKQEIDEPAENVPIYDTFANLNLLMYEFNELNSGKQKKTDLITPEVVESSVCVNENHEATGIPVEFAEQDECKAEGACGHCDNDLFERYGYRVRR